MWSELWHYGEVVVDNLSEVFATEFIEHACVSWFHSELTQVVNDLDEFLLSFGSKVVFVKSDVGGTILGKHVHSHERCFSIANGRLIACFVEHGLLLNKQCFSHPLHILSKVSIQLIPLFDQSQRENKCTEICVNHRPHNRTDHQTHSLTSWNQSNFVIRNHNHSLLHHELKLLIEVCLSFRCDLILEDFLAFE